VSPIGQRASNDDRLRIVAELEQHTVDGRLSLDEFSSRVEQVYRAATHADLALITGDLPRPARARHDQWYLLGAMVLSIATIAALAFSLKLW
jgi:hypothetical protein